MGRIKEIIENEIPGVYVYSMKIGETIIEVIQTLIKNYRKTF